MVSRMDIERVRKFNRALAGQSLDVVRDLCTDAEIARQSRAAARALGRTHRSTFKCEQCGKFKPRPSAVCPGANCGDHPVPVGMDAHEFDRDYGWDDGGGEGGHLS